MSQYNSRFTFGNILIGLLLLGTVVVIGLIVLVYLQLTSPEKRSTVSQPETASPTQVEIMSPDGKTVQRAAVNASEPAQVASSANAQQQQEAEAAANALAVGAGAAAVTGAAVNTRALTSGAHAQQPRKPRPKRRENAQSNNTTPRSSGNSHANREEVPLEPVNVNRERPLTPRNTSSGERPLQPRNRNNSERNANSGSGERPLVPTKPRQKQSEAIDALF